jgi:membrane protease YdiL (CAAX protease family)
VERGTSLKRIGTFLILVFGISSIFYILIIKNGLEAGGGYYALGLMWSPGMAALVTCAIYRKKLSDLGWRLNWRYSLASYAIPIAYSLISYVFVWVTALGGFYNKEFVEKAASQLGLSSLPHFVAIPLIFLVGGIVGMLGSSFSALGEEIGWRGFLVPELARISSFTRVAFISGAMWAVWHYPLLIFSNYNGGTPIWYSLSCFTVMIMAISFIFAWMRLRSGSLWTGVFLHASHNLFIQSILSPLTIDTGKTRYFIDEFGAVLPIVCIAFGVAFWKMRSRLKGGAITSDAAVGVLHPA